MCNPGLAARVPSIPARGTAARRGTVVRLRTLAVLFAASSLVTIGLNAAGAFDRNNVRNAVRREMVEHGVDVSDMDHESRTELPVTLLRASNATDEFSWSGVPRSGQSLEIRSLLGTI